MRQKWVSICTIMQLFDIMWKSRSYQYWNGQHKEEIIVLDWKKYQTRQTMLQKCNNWFLIEHISFLLLLTDRCLIERVQDHLLSKYVTSPWTCSSMMSYDWTIQPQNAMIRRATIPTGCSLQSQAADPYRGESVPERTNHHSPNSQFLRRYTSIEIIWLESLSTEKSAIIEKSEFVVHKYTDD